MNKDYFEEFAGERVKLTTIDDQVFRGVLWFIRFEDEREIEVHSIALDSCRFEFLTRDIKKIEIIKDLPGYLNPSSYFRS